MCATASAGALPGSLRFVGNSERVASPFQKMPSFAHGATQRGAAARGERQNRRKSRRTGNRPFGPPLAMLWTATPTAHGIVAPYAPRHGIHEIT